MTKKTYVIGAGVCGLTTAYRLQQAGFQVTVLEGNNYSGGRTLTSEQNNFKVDEGASLMPSSYKEHLELSREVGLGDDIIAVPSTSGTYIDGQFHFMDMDKPISGLVSAPYLTLSSKLGLARLIPTLLKYRSSLGFSDLSGAASSDTQTAKEFCQQYLNDEVYERLINPLLRGMYIANGDDVSVTQLLWILSNFSGVSVFGFKNGMQSLANTLAQKLDVEYGVDIQRVDHSSDGVEISANREGAPIKFSADLCVIATDGKDLQQIYGDQLTEKQNHFLSNMVYSPIKMITYMTDKRPKEEAVLTMPTQEDDADLALIVMDHLYGPSRCPEGTGIISFLAMTQLQKDWVTDTEHTKLREFGQQRLNKYFPELVDHVTQVNTRYWPRACTVGVPGTYRNLKAFVDDIDPNSAVYYTGDYMVASSVGVAVSTGNAVARRIIKKLG